ncbi:MAG: M42 family metallopeptidase [Candidatus Eisenbacteria bacterium]|nr:M42 family metallopeptidase [Candidatus Eisenbacteria bacterium]
MDSVSLLRELSEAVGAPGNEEEVRAIVRARIAGLADGIEADVVGNLFAWRGDPRGPTVMVAAHTDEVGLLVSAVEPAGFLRVVPLGRSDPRVLPGQEVVVMTASGKRVFGAVGIPSPHLTQESQRTVVPPVEAQFVDIGAQSADDVAARGIRVGDPAVLNAAFRTLDRRMIMGKALDDRAGCAWLLCVLERLARVDLNIRLVAAFTCQEEVGIRGATVAGFRINPDVAIALEGTAAGDFPGIEPHRVPVAVGRGVALTIADNRFLAHRGFFRFAERVAEAHDIPHQTKAPLFGGTDAGALHLTRAGVMTGVMSIPCRYIHTPRAIMSLDDFDAGVDLLATVLSEVGEWLRSTGQAPG